MLIVCEERSEIDALKTLLGTTFDMKDLGSTKRILEVDIRTNRSEGLVFLSQEKYLKKILETFDMEDSKPVQGPLAAHFKLCNLYCPKSEEERLEMTSIPYAKAVGCLMYAIVLTRPDISHDVSVVSRYMTSSSKEHWKWVKWILRYLKRTLNLGLVYGKNSRTEEGLWGYVDSDYVGDLDRRRLFIG